MHSRIFQIEDKPVSKEDRIYSETIPDWFTSSIADYVDDINEQYRDDDIEWLMGTNFGEVCKLDGDKITFKVDAIDFFESYFTRFMDAVKRLSDISIDQFIDAFKHGSESVDSLMFQLEKSYNDKRGFYVWYCDELYTMQEWMRQVKPSGVYYLGGIVDYHF